MQRLRALAVTATITALPACRPKARPPAPAASASEAAPAASSPAIAARIAELEQAEARRLGSAVTAADAANRDVRVRRAAARALARMRRANAREQLLAALADEDGQVVAWAAFGLGEACAGKREAIVRALVAAAASLSARGIETTGGEPGLDPLAAIARSLGRCAADASEPVLVDWAKARGRQAQAAIFGLGDLLARRGKLREETFVALLELAAGSASDQPWPLALYPLGRAEHLPPSVVGRAREVALLRLADAKEQRVLAIRALGRTDDEAAPPLAELLGHPDKASATERAEAARALGRLGAAGQKALREALSALLPAVSEAARDPLGATGLVAADFGPLLAALSGLTEVGGARAMIARYAALPAPAEAPAAVLRRLSLLRCAAASLLAERDFDNALLVHCDLTADGAIGARAVVAAIGITGTEIRGKRHRAYARLAGGGDLRAREDAIRLIGGHREIEDAGAFLLAALQAPQAGLVAAAAEVIAQHPDRVDGRPEKAGAREGGKRRKDQKLAQRIGAELVLRLDASGPSSDPKALAAAIDASGALQLDAARQPLRALCGSPDDAVRAHAEKALAQILGGEQKIACAAPEPGRAADELSHLAARPVKLKLDSDAGQLGLSLDARLAPLAVTRLVDLVRSGFYDGMIVDRVLPGFLVQLGSPTADGFGGAPGKPPLPWEASPVAFSALSVGMALPERDLADRDGAVSQFFVTAAAEPQLDGQYAWLGAADGPWSALVEGDRIIKATVAP